MTGWRNAWSMKQRVQDQEEDRRGPGERLSKRTVMHANWIQRMLIKDVQWSGWMWVGECFFWYWPTRVVPDQRSLNGCVCVCVCSIAHSLFHSRLKTYLFCKSFPPQPFLFFSRNEYMIPQTLTATSEHIRFYFFCFTLFSCRLRAID